MTDLHAAEQKLTAYAVELIHKGADLDKRAEVIARKELIAKLETIVVPATAPARVGGFAGAPPGPRTHYVRDGGAEEWAKGEWVQRDEGYWELQARQVRPSRLLEVYDLPSVPTVIEHHTYGKVVTRGCSVCGLRDLVRPPSPIRFGRWWGSFCVEHHQAWEALSISDRKTRPGLFVTYALRSAGFIDKSVPSVTVIEHSPDFSEEVPNVLTPWRPFTWAHRVMKAEHPETQEPGSAAFFFLAGPIRVAVGEGEA